MKNSIKTGLLLTAIIFTSIYQANAQGLVDGFFAKKGDATVSLSYSYSEFDAFYVGADKVDGVPVHNEITQNIYNLYANYGITDKLTAIVNLPYISAEGNGAADPFNGETEQSGLQDISIALKYALYKEALKTGSMTYFTALSGTYALDYEPNGILSIGNGAPSADVKLGMHYKNNNGFFGTVALGYTVRGNADNNFNVGDGSDFNAPNSANALIKLGYASSKIYVDAWFDAQNTSNKAVNISDATFVGNFPETRVNYSRVGGDVYVPLTSAFGLSAGINTLVDGTNIGDSTTYTGGIIYKLNK